MGTDVGVDKFRVLVADPAWKFDDKLPGPNRGAERNYSCMTTYEICRFLDDNHWEGIPFRDQLADDCVLFLWRVASQQQAALDVARAWGFTVKSEVVWLKKTSHGNRWFGMGRVVRAEHEICLIATRKRQEPLSHSVRSAFVTDFEGLSATVGRHSEKPEQFFDIVESLYPGPYLEIFARRQRPNWVCLGNEVSEVQCR